MGLRRRELAGAARGEVRPASTIPAVAQASKPGWVYVHDRETGKLLFKSQAFVPQRNMFTPPQPDSGVVIAPGIAGGANWSPSAYDPKRQFFFVAALHLPTRYIAHDGQATRRQRAGVRQHAEHQYVVGHADGARPVFRWQAALAGEDRRAADRWRARDRGRPGVLGCREGQVRGLRLRQPGASCGTGSAMPASMRRRSPMRSADGSTSRWPSGAMPCSALRRATW